MASTTTSGALPTATDSAGGGSGQGHGGGPTSSPLLFFVALGFGVVFTNLWYAFPDFARRRDSPTSLHMTLTICHCTQDHRRRKILLQI